MELSTVAHFQDGNYYTIVSAIIMLSLDASRGRGLILKNLSYHSQKQHLNNPCRQSYSQINVSVLHIYNIYLIQLVSFINQNYQLIKTKTAHRVLNVISRKIELKVVCTRGKQKYIYTYYKTIIYITQSTYTEREICLKKGKRNIFHKLFYTYQLLILPTFLRHNF